MKIFKFLFANKGDNKLLEEKMIGGDNPTLQQKWEIPPMESPVFVISDEALLELKKGKPEVRFFPYSPFSILDVDQAKGEVYPSMEAALKGIATRGNAKFHIMEITKHVCTEIILKQDC